MVTDLGGADDAAAAGIDAAGRLLVAAYARPTAVGVGVLARNARGGSASGQGCVRYLAGRSTRPSKPAIITFTPIKGKRGAKVTIKGKNFRVTRGRGYVTFGATKCAKYFSWTATRIRCRVPSKARYGRLRVSVTSKGGTARALQGFTVKR